MTRKAVTASLLASLFLLGAPLVSQARPVVHHHKHVHHAQHMHRGPAKTYYYWSHGHMHKGVYVQAPAHNPF